MSQVRKRGEKVRHFILANIEKFPSTIAKITSEKFKISRQAVNVHLRKLAQEKSISRTGKTRNLTHRLSILLEWNKTYEISPKLEEHVVWLKDVKIALAPLPENVMDIWGYGFTEMFNNAIDHSDGHSIKVRLKKTENYSELAIFDDGVGIFKKIQTIFDLPDERHAVLELAKGKLTTDPKRHTGEGIFFTSRMFDSFDILSGGVFFTHKFGNPEDWIMEPKINHEGTFVWMKLDNHTSRTDKEIFDQYTSSEDYGFNKTVVPVRLAQYGNDKLISRSQARRLLSRVELFKTVIFDFSEVESIGQAFADEIFRVFRRQHPDIKIIGVNENSEVSNMIKRAESVPQIP